MNRVFISIGMSPSGNIFLAHYSQALAFICLNTFHLALLIGFGKDRRRLLGLAEAIPVEVGGEKKSSTDS